MMQPALLQDVGPPGLTRRSLLMGDSTACILIGFRARTPTPPGTASHSDFTTPCGMRSGCGGPHDGVKLLSPSPSCAVANFCPPFVSEHSANMRTSAWTALISGKCVLTDVRFRIASSKGATVAKMAARPLLVLALRCPWPPPWLTPAPACMVKPLLDFSPWDIDLSLPPGGARPGSRPLVASGLLILFALCGAC